MTLFELLKKGKTELSSISEDSGFEAWMLLSHCFDLDRSEYYKNSSIQADKKSEKDFFKLLKDRKNGRPLQYIIGKWSFFESEFYVGEGVLIPRADTECLVEKSAEIIKKNNVKTVFDLCAGTGCIGISLAKMFKNINVTCVEKSEDALYFLEKNVELNNVNNVKIIKGDIFSGAYELCLDACELIVSNPPYIKSDEIPSLQKEVHFEPRQALDGGFDGLEFYRALKEKWFDEMAMCRSIVMECGEDQADDVRDIFSEYENICFVKDFNNIRRDVCVFKNGVK